MQITANITELDKFINNLKMTLMVDRLSVDAFASPLSFSKIFSKTQNRQAFRTVNAVDLGNL